MLISSLRRFVLPPRLLLFRFCVLVISPFRRFLLHSSTPNSHLTFFSTMPGDWSRRQVETASGLIAGFSNTIVTHPLDLIKIRLQLLNLPSSRPFDSLRNVIAGISHDATLAAQKNGSKRPHALHVLQQCYRGATPNLLGNVSAWGLYFALYAEFKQHMPTEDGTAKYLTASTLAGVSTLVLTNPIWVLKTRMLSTSSQAANSYKSVVDGVRQILRNEGVATFWTGTVPSLFSVFQLSLQFTLYDHAKHYLLESPSSELTTFQYIYASVFSKTVSMSIWYPAQVVRSRLQSYNFEKEKRGLRLVISTIYSKEGGWRGFYRGLSANIVRVLPSTIITFVTYETTRNYLLHS